MAKYIIYQLVDPVGKNPFYVGSTTKSIRERLSIHMWCAKNRPVGSVYDYINNLSKRPIIEMLESGECDDKERIRQRELFWLNKLNDDGYILTNDNKPHRDYTPMRGKLTEEELQFLRDNIKYLTSLNRIEGEIIKMQIAHRVVKTGSAARATLEKVRTFLSIIRTRGIPNFKNKYSPSMVVLSSTEMQNLAKWKKTVNMRNLYKNIGVSDETINRVLKSGRLRHDKYSKISKFINNG